MDRAITIDFKWVSMQVTNITGLAMKEDGELRGEVLENGIMRALSLEDILTKLMGCMNCLTQKHMAIYEDGN